MHYGPVPLTRTNIFVQSATSASECPLLLSFAKSRFPSWISQVRLNGIVFDVNLYFRRALVLPGALDVASFNETRYLLPIQYAVESSFVQLVAEANRTTAAYEVEDISFFFQPPLSSAIIQYFRWE